FSCSCPTPYLHSFPTRRSSDLPVQAFAVYEKGVLMKWGPSNMGKKATQTPRGLFFTNWKGRRVRSTVDEEWILNWNFNIHNTGGDRKSTRLNSSHVKISYAVFC